MHYLSFSDLLSVNRAAISIDYKHLGTMFIESRYPEIMCLFRVVIVRCLV